MDHEKRAGLATCPFFKLDDLAIIYLLISSGLYDPCFSSL